MYSDADEIIHPSVLRTMKFYDIFDRGRIQIRYEHYSYGFFCPLSEPTTLHVGTILETFRHSLAYSLHSVRNSQFYIEGSALAEHLRKVICINSLKSKELCRSRRRSPDTVMFGIGNENYFSGFHCSWCFNPEGLRVKLVSAQNGDFPRWGDFPEKLERKYLECLIEKREYFDGQLMSCGNRQTDIFQIIKNSTRRQISNRLRSRFSELSDIPSEKKFLHLKSCNDMHQKTVLRK
ncbi:hypothetical protein SNEBB_010003 [Seison nebaliae]|nr:hypothetical protein SNEBB_010003 [Seison nebaliae]